MHAQACGLVEKHGDVARGHEALLFDLFPGHRLDADGFLLDAPLGTAGGDDDALGLDGQVIQPHRQCGVTCLEEDELHPRRREPDAVRLDEVLARRQFESGRGVGTGEGREAGGADPHPFDGTQGALRSHRDRTGLCVKVHGNRSRTEGSQGGEREEDDDGGEGGRTPEVKPHRQLPH
mgnify:CR=1 FL=1